MMTQSATTITARAWRIAAALLSGGWAALATPALADDTTIRVASVTGPAHHHNVSLRWFAEQVAARDSGLTIEVLDGAQLGGERDYIEGMMLGSIQMAQVSTAHRSPASCPSSTSSACPT